MPSTFNRESKITSLAKTPFLHSPLGLAPKTRGTTKEWVMTEMETLSQQRDTGVAPSLHHPLQQERVTGEVGLLGNGPGCCRAFHLSFP